MKFSVGTFITYTNPKGLLQPRSMTLQSGDAAKKGDTETGFLVENAYFSYSFMATGS